jgi:glycosyltransferase involved in cell wall biosynthesis
MIKIYDCSNSYERPPHRGGGGPVQNDIMRYLKENAHNYDSMFVEELEKCDVVITNDVFPKNVLDSKKPLVKRMDGVFWHNNFIGRNKQLVEAALQADRVIFISDYSSDSFYNIYGIKTMGQMAYNSVIRHWVDPKIFNNIPRIPNKKFIFAASATNWQREEKRFLDINNFANLFQDSCHIILIGKNPHPMLMVSQNITKLGYIESPEKMAGIFNSCDGFLNLSYRDAATKTVPQAISCGLPVLYADSGGVGEMAGEYGIGIKEYQDYSILNDVPRLTESQLEDGYIRYMINYSNIKEKLMKFDPNVKFNKMLDEYFNAIKWVL